MNSIIDAQQEFENCKEPDPKKLLKEKIVEMMLDGKLNLIKAKKEDKGGGFI